jgi:hypothetical protein
MSSSAVLTDKRYDNKCNNITCRYARETETEITSEKGRRKKKNIIYHI